MKPKEKLINFKVSQEFYKRLKRAAVKLDVTYSELIRRAVGAEIERILNGVGTDKN